MIQNPTEFLHWLASKNPNADLSLAVINDGGKPRWILHFEGLPNHIGTIHTEGDTAEYVTRSAQTQITNAIARHMRKRAEEREKTCKFATKKRYLTEAEALHALRTISRTWPTTERVPTEAYYCDPQDSRAYGCGGWHLTSHPYNRALITEPLRPKENA